jgi:hypothetical protein
MVLLICTCPFTICTYFYIYAVTFNRPPRHRELFPETAAAAAAAAAASAAVYGSVAATASATRSAPTPVAALATLAAASPKTVCGRRLVQRVGCCVIGGRAVSMPVVKLHVLFCVTSSLHGG